MKQKKIHFMIYIPHPHPNIMFGVWIFTLRVLLCFYMWYSISWRIFYIVRGCFFLTFKVDKMLYVQSKNFYLKFLWTINKNILDECIRYLFSHCMREYFICPILCVLKYMLPSLIYCIHTSEIFKTFELFFAVFFYQNAKSLLY